MGPKGFNNVESTSIYITHEIDDTYPDGSPYVVLVGVYQHRPLIY